MKTWKLELAVVALVLGAVVLVTRGGLLEAVGALAVICTFGHAQVAERMREKEALKSKPDVHCHRWSTRYFLAKELLWLSYFVAHESWSALVGVGVFLLYPLWRKWWRARRPIAPKRIVFGQPSKVYINGFACNMMPASDIIADSPWSAGLVLRLNQSGCEFIARISRERMAMHVVFWMGDDYALAGGGMPQRLQFWDDPGQPGVRFAALNVAGVGELANV